MEDDSQFIKKVLSPTPEILNATEPLRKETDHVQSAMEHIRNLFLKTPNAFSEIPITHEQFNERLNNFERAFRESLRNLHKSSPEMLYIIAQHGWYMEFNSDIRIITLLGSELSRKKEEIATDYLLKYYTRHLERIFTELKERHSSRGEIFDEIYKALEQQQYFVAIPCILSQVDGICYDFSHKKFFLKDPDQHLPQVRSEIEKLSNSALDLFLTPFQRQTPIMVQEKKIQDYPCTLNRHEIIHGVNTTYGSQLNSLKCISLLKYVSDVINEVSKARTEENKQ